MPGSHPGSQSPGKGGYGADGRAEGEADEPGPGIPSGVSPGHSPQVKQDKVSPATACVPKTVKTLIRVAAAPARNPAISISFLTPAGLEATHQKAANPYSSPGNLGPPTAPPLE